ncbi:hypothetical protein NK718_13430 [Alsobacter sp. SYSU M60028]|uniref:Uncharacterized protein n=1 Tax=Alsobacter ponti TaxID=2962936 RepID=A0ABT1LDE1_9HYPH|nr:hypothetical protein [Alsobacter ponti]MCP8939522.1 hypothetical protein [Alsobacter ponti]
MTDSIQRTSSIPLPLHQTVRGAQDPLPLDKPERIAADEAKRNAPAVEDSAKAFETYLNDTAFTIAERARKSVEADPALDIHAASAYGGLGQSGI